MTGPEHYQRAEALLAYQQQPNFTDVDEHGRIVECYAAVDEDDISRNALMAAQVHATLALAAATLEAAPVDPNAIDPGWRSATGVRS